MKIGGLQKFSLLDYPGAVCAVIFTQGCNFRCPFCHNPQLVLPKKFDSPLDEESVFTFLKSRINKLDAVTITGGEPSLQPDLLPFIRRVKALGFKVKLDTNGSNPELISSGLEQGLLDFIAMDIKAPLENYDTLCGVKVNRQAIEDSIRIILYSGLPYQLRTTLVPQLITPDMKTVISTWMNTIAAQHIFQPFVDSGDLLNPKFLE